MLQLVQPIRKVSGFLGLRAESEANETQKEKRRTLFLQEERMQKLLNPFPKEIPLVLFLQEERMQKIIKSISEGNTLLALFINLIKKK